MLSPASSHMRHNVMIKLCRKASEIILDASEFLPNRSDGSRVGIHNSYWSIACRRSFLESERPEVSRGRRAWLPTSRFHRHFVAGALNANRPDGLVAGRRDK